MERTIEQLLQMSDSSAPAPKPAPRSSPASASRPPQKSAAPAPPRAAAADGKEHFDKIDGLFDLNMASIPNDFLRPYEFFSPIPSESASLPSSAAPLSQDQLLAQIARNPALLAELAAHPELLQNPALLESRIKAGSSSSSTAPAPASAASASAAPSVPALSAGGQTRLRFLVDLFKRKNEAAASSEYSSLEQDESDPDMHTVP